MRHGSRITESKIDVLIFFWGPLGHQSYDSDVKALLRLATAFNIPNACDEATADCIISSLLLDPEPKAVAVLDAFALAIIAGGSTRVYPGVAGYEPDLMLARNDAKKIKESMVELRKLVRDPGSYLSESNFFESSWQRSFWGSNYPKLQAIKEKYDPAGPLFRSPRGG